MNWVKDLDVMKVRNELFKVNKDVREVVEKIDERVVYAGIKIGEEKKHFKPTLHYLDEQAKKDDNKVFVNDKAEWLFLCGRDVFMENIVKNNAKKNTFLVQNERDENLGLGSFKGKVIMNKYDKGLYLRKKH